MMIIYDSPVKTPYFCEWTFDWQIIYFTYPVSIQQDGKIRDRHGAA